MNITIIKMLVRFLSLLVVSASSLLNSVSINTSIVGINNSDKNKSSSPISTIIKYETVINYNSKIPSGIKKIKVEGQDGEVYLDPQGNVFNTLKEKRDEIIEIGIGKAGSYTGLLTGYGPDCVSCDGRGYVYCKSPNGKYFNLVNDGMYYNDSEYGQVRIVAADQREFPCGTIVEVDNSLMKEGKFLAIVLDTGYAMRKAYDNGNIHMDLAFTTQKNLIFQTNYSTNFSVQRWGW